MTLYYIESNKIRRTVEADTAWHAAVKACQDLDYDQLCEHWDHLVVSRHGYYTDQEPPETGYVLPIECVLDCIESDNSEVDLYPSMLLPESFTTQVSVFGVNAQRPITVRRGTGQLAIVVTEEAESQQAEAARERGQRCRDLPPR